MKNAFTLILISLLFIGCKCQLNNLKSVDKYLKKEQDSILSIVNNLCGAWEIETEKEQKLSLKGIYVLQMNIECLVKIDNNELLNQLYIDNYGVMSELGVILPDTISEVFLPKSDSVSVSKRKKHYGFEYYDKGNVTFIPIETLNDSILKLIDGREFTRIE